MQVQIQKIAYETVTIKPGYYQHNLCSKMFYQVFASGAVVAINPHYISMSFPDEKYYPNKIQDILENYEQCSKNVFEEVKDQTVSLLAGFIKFPEMSANVNPASGQSGVNHMLDPNVKQAEEANQDAIAGEATGQPTQATEGTDNAQDSEEGTTEG